VKNESVDGKALKRKLESLNYAFGIHQSQQKTDMRLVIANKPVFFSKLNPTFQDKIFYKTSWIISIQPFTDQN
jgi:hypothetical protein